MGGLLSALASILVPGRVATIPTLNFGELQFPKCSLHVGSKQSRFKPDVSATFGALRYRMCLLYRVTFAA